VPSGEVKSVKLAGDEVIVEFTLDKGIRLGAQTTAAVRVATLLGTHYLAVDPQGSGSLTGDNLPRAQTSVPYNLQDVIDRGTEQLEKLDPALISKALTVVSETTEASQAEFGPALKGIARVSQVIATRTDQAGELLEAARGVADQLSDSSTDLLELMRQTNLVLDEVLGRRVEIHDLLVKTIALSKALTSIVTDTQADLKPALKDTHTVMAMLKSQEKKLQEALSVLAPTARYLANATGSGNYVTTVPADGLPDGLICKGKGTC